MRMSAFGTKQTRRAFSRLSAFGGKADIGWLPQPIPPAYE
jgi:hypothetical protein